MADAEAWAIACEPALNMEKGSFMRARTANVKGMARSALDMHPPFPLVEQIAKKGFDGLMGGSHQRLEDLADDQMKRRDGWPRTPGVQSAQLGRLAPNLFAAGIEVWVGKHGEKGVPVRIGSVKVGKSASGASGASAGPRDEPESETVI